MKEEIQKLIQGYFHWLKDKTVLKQINQSWLEITTPHLDRHNDCLQIYAKKDTNGYILTDDGYVIGDLINSGCSLATPKRQELLKLTLAGFGVRLEDESLQIHATPENFSLKKHSILQAMLAVNDLFYLSSPMVSSLFYEDVVAWLDVSDIRYTPNVKFTGKSGYDHLFEFVIPKSKKQPERIIQTLNHPRKDSAEALVFKWLDTKDTRPKDSKLFAFLNNTDFQVSQSVLDAIRNYNAIPVLWTEKSDSKSILAA